MNDNKKLGQGPTFPLFKQFGNNKQRDMGISKRFYAACMIVKGTISNEELRVKLLMDAKNEKIHPIKYL